MSSLSEMIAQQLEESQRTLAAALAIQADIAALTGTGSSEDRIAEVTVDAKGIIQDVRLKPALARSAAELGAALMDAQRAALADLQHNRDELVGPVPGDPRPLTERTDFLDVMDQLRHNMHEQQGRS